MHVVCVVPFVYHKTCTHESMKRQRMIHMLDLNTLPDLVNANDEDLFAAVCETLCHQKGIDPRFGAGNNLDEYHDIPLNEMYELHVPENYDELDYPKDEHGNIIVLVPKQAMIDYASDDLDYYAGHDAAEHEDNDITKPSKRHPDGLPTCFTCELIQNFAFEDLLKSMPLDERIDLLRAYLDQFMPTEYEPYEINPSDHNVYYYRIIHDGEEVGTVQFNDTLDQIIVPMAGHDYLFDAQQRHFGKKTTTDMNNEMREKYPHLYE